MRADQIATAGGMVECGECGDAFSALEYLRDGETIEAGSGEPIEAESQVPVDHAAADEAALEADQIRQSPALDEVDESSRILLEPLASSGEAENNAEPAAAGADLDVPELLRRDLIDLERRPAGLWRTLAGATVTLLLGVLLAAQVAWMERGWLLARIPRSQSLIDRVCAVAHTLPGCNAPNGSSDIALIAREVREHPHYENALLLNATLLNNAESSRPYPVISLKLRDINGSLLGAREFRPNEYLDPSLASADGLAAKIPVYIVMELQGYAANAVSFEFAFL